MNLEELQTARDRERQTDKLQQLRESFYADAGEFIQQLRAERERAAERADDPFDAPEVNQLTDEINTAEQTVEAIYEKRVGKIVKAASFAAADLPAEAEGMTGEEQELFETLVADIKENRQHVLDVLAGEEPAGDETPPAETQTQAGNPGETASPAPDGESAGDGVSAADLMGSGTETADRRPVPPEPSDEHPPEPGPSGAEPPSAGEPDAGGNTAADRESPSRAETAATDVTPPHQGDAIRNDGGQPTAGVDVGETPADTPNSPEPNTHVSGPEPDPAGESRAETAEIERRTVRVTEDVATFVGSDDRDYDLEPDDVVTLPESNARLLLDRDAAEEL